MTNWAKKIFMEMKLMEIRQSKFPANNVVTDSQNTVDLSKFDTIIKNE